MLKILCLLLCLLFSAVATAQKVFTACDVTFHTMYDADLPDTSQLNPPRLRAGLIRDWPVEATVYVTINVVKGKYEVVNTSISALHNDEWITTATSNNLLLLTFLQDTANYVIVFKYRYNNDLVNNYAEIINDTILIVSRPPLSKYQGYPTHGISPNIVDTQVIDGVRTLVCTFNKVLKVDAYLHSPSNILIERIIDAGEEGIKIRQNNYPELAKRLLNAAQKYSNPELKEALLWYMKYNKITSTLPIRYFYKFHLHREVCNVFRNR